MSKFVKLSAILVIVMACGHVFAGAYPTKIEGRDILTHEKVGVSADGADGLVVAFLSCTCPCSNSHIDELASLAKTYSRFHFVAVHSNADENEKSAEIYFKARQLPFAVLQDTGTQLADTFRANRTPHVFVVSPKGEVVYQGGVSDSSHFEQAKQKYLRDALADLNAGVKVRTPAGRTLGCMISREKHAL